MPWKQFLDGEILDASEVNTYFMNQAILVFATQSARNSAITSPTAGMFSYITADSTIYIYDGSAWVAQIATIEDDAVTTAKILNGAVTADKLAADSVTTAKIADSVTLTTPNIGVATATSVNGLTLSSSTGTLTISNGKTLSATGSITLAGTDSSTLTVSGNVTIGSSTHTVAFTTTGNTSLALPTTGTVATLGGSETITNKTVNLTSNTLSGTKAQFNTALSDANFLTTTDSAIVTETMIDYTTVPRQFVQSSQPSGKSGDIWVKV